MPRKYICKKPLPSYSVDDVVHAVADVQNKNMTFRAAQEAYGVPVSVIYNRINGRRNSLEKIGQGRGNALPLEVESEIVKCLLQRSSSGYPCDKEELRELIAQYVVSNNLKTPFHNSKPGEEWYRNFMKRNPVLSLKKPELLQKCRKDARKHEIIYDFYNKLKKVVMDCGLNDEKSNFVFNADESGFCSDPNKLRAIGQKGVSLSRLTGGSGRESTTVLACVSADGYALPPLIIFKGAAVQARWTNNEAYPGTLYGASKNGWMEEPQFYHWFINGFIPHIIRLREKQNVPGQAALLLYDGHSSHISVRIVEGAIKNNIQLLRFPSHLTDKLQPLDKAVFGPVKVAWEKVLVRYGKEMIGKGLFQLPKANFVKLLGIVWKTALIPKNIQAGFDSTGVFPVNASKFPETDFNQLELKKYYREILEIPPETIQNAEAEEPQTTPSNLSAPIQSQNNVQSSTSQPTQALNSMPQTFIERINSSSSSAGSPYIHANSGNVLVTQCTTTSLTSRSSSTSVIGAESPVSEQNNGQNVFSLPEDLSSFNELSPIPSTSKAASSVHTKIVNLFAVPSQLLNTTPKRIVTPRLKQLKYGEILTTDEVLQRLREAEEKKMLKCEPRKKNLKNKQKQKKATRPKKKILLSSSSEEESPNYKPADDDLQDLDWGEEENLDDPDEVDMMEVKQIQDFHAGEFILASFKGGKRNTTSFKYVCRVELVDIGEAEIKVQGLAAANSSKTIFKILRNDVSFIKVSEVIAMLPPPKETLEDDGSVNYTFDNIVPVKEMC